MQDLAFAPSTCITFSIFPQRTNPTSKYSYRPLPIRELPITLTFPKPPPHASLPPPDRISPLLPDSTIATILNGTILASDHLSLPYTSTRDGFDNRVFFDCLAPLGGVPSLVLGRTVSGTIFGGYAASGFLARDDYRETTNPRSMFVFRIAEDGQVLFAEPTDLVQYDFYDYAVRLGATLLGVPMNPRKHIMKADMATSSCRLPNGETSVFGDATLAKIAELQVWVAEKYMAELKRNKKSGGGGLFSRLFQ